MPGATALDTGEIVLRFDCLFDSRYADFRDDARFSPADRLITFRRNPQSLHCKLLQCRQQFPQVPSPNLNIMVRKRQAQ